MAKRVSIARNESLPSINFLKHAFEEFKSIDDKDYETIIQSFLNLFKSYPPLTLHLANEEYLKSFKAYRVISEDDIILNSLDINNIDSFSHPQIGKAAQNRFNIQGSPVLYLSSTPHTAIEEKYDQKCRDKVLYVSNWKFSNIIPLSYILLIYKKHFNDPTFIEASENLEKNMEERFRIYTKEKRKALKYFWEQITDLSLSEPFSNKTSALGHYYFYKTSPKLNYPIAFIIYPSVKKKGNGYNYAVNPKLISDQVLTCTGIQKIRLKKHEKIGSEFTLLGIGNVTNDKVIWKNDFGYKIESASFFNLNGKAFLNYHGSELEEYRFNSYDNKDSLSVCEFLNMRVGNKLIEELILLSTTNETEILKKYRYTLSEIITIDNEKCNKIHFNVLYKLSNS